MLLKIYKSYSWNHFNVSNIKKKLHCRSLQITDIYSEYYFLNLRVFKFEIYFHNLKRLFSENYLLISGKTALNLEYKTELISHDLFKNKFFYTE